HVYAPAPGARTDGTGAPAGVVVMGRFIRPAALANREQLEVTLVTAQSALLSEQAGAFDAEPTESGSWKSPQARYSLIALRASNGDVAGAVLAQSPRRITALGQRAIDLAAGAIAIGAMISLALLWWLIHHFTIRRIANLERHLAQQNEVSDLRELRLAPSGDEIGALSETYNKLVRRLQEAQTTAQTATADKTVATNTNRMKSALMANISYRLRTPLTAMIGYSELIEEELSDTARMQAGADLQRIRALAQQVLKLANEIFELSNIDADKVELRPSAFSPAEIIVEITDNARAAAEVNETRIDVRIAADTGMAYTDEHRLRQCLANVIDNACKYTRQGVVSVTTGRARKHGRDWLTFKIADTGQGIAPENLARIFEPFAETGSEKGLGLAITQKLLTLLGGDIFVSSELGQGSVFVMRVPAILPESAEPESERRTG
ncbi:MAG: sensor histidine kinase, partial [Hyphomonadaceae bacterium]